VFITQTKIQNFMQPVTKVGNYSCENANTTSLHNALDGFALLQPSIASLIMLLYLSSSDSTGDLRFKAIVTL
jgi:hypothetical protein